MLTQFRTHCQDHGLGRFSLIAASRPRASGAGPHNRGSGVGARAPCPAGHSSCPLGGRDRDRARLRRGEPGTLNPARLRCRLRRFVLWCQRRATAALPASPALVAVYLSFLADRRLAPPSVARALAAIAHVHRRAGYVPPQSTRDGMVITDALAGIRARDQRRRTGRTRPMPRFFITCCSRLRATAFPRCGIGR